MKTNYIKDNYQFQLLTKEHDLNDFECTSKDLSDFLKKDALDQQEMCLNTTNLIICDGKIIGFVSLLADKFKLGKIEDEKVRNRIKEKLRITGNKNNIPAELKHRDKSLFFHLFNQFFIFF